MKKIIVVALTLLAVNAQAAVLCDSLNGGVPYNAGSLANAAVSPSCKDTTVRVTTALSAAFSNISSATVHEWPADRALCVEKGGSLSNTTTIRASGNLVLNGGTLRGTGRVIGPITVIGDYEAFETTSDISGLDKAYVDNFESGITAAATAINPGGIIYLGSGTYIPTASVTLKEGVTIEGISPKETIYDASALSSFAFIYTTANGTGQLKAPRFKHFTLYAQNGIKLNDPANGFTDTSASQMYLFNSLIEDMHIENKGVTGGIGIQASKLFDSHIEKNYIQNFQRCIELNGSDINAITDNRMIGCGGINGSTIAINPVSTAGYYGTFGSQNSIVHNELLSPVAGSDAMIFSRDRSTRIYNNYFEQDPARNSITAVIWLIGGTDAMIKENRIEFDTASTPYWLKVDSFYPYLDAENNTNLTGPVPTVSFPSGGQPLHYNSSYRYTLKHSGNMSEAGFPYNNTYRGIPPAGSNLYAWTVDTDNTSLFQSGQTLYAQNGVLTLVPAASPFSLYLQPNAINEGNVTGTIKVGIVAKGATSGQKVTVYLLDNGAYAGSFTITLTDTYAYYETTAVVVSTALNIQVYNNDTTGNSNVFLKSVVVH